MTHELEVWLFANHVGNLSRVEGKLCFCYTANWLSQPNAAPLSVALPLQAAPFEDRQARPFFAGLLPDGNLRHMLAQQFQVSLQNDIALLEHMGGECAGAVTFLEPGQILRNEHVDDVQWLTDEEVITVLLKLPRRPMLADQQELRLSLAGAQNKLPVVVKGNRIGLPRYDTPSSHILKLPIDGVEDSVHNECFCLALARAIQLQPANAYVHTVLNHPFLLVERYDRIANDQKHRKRLHQEDFCQALGIAPEIKYQNEGGPDLAQCFHLIRRATQPSGPQVLRLFNCIVFNTLIGNHDAHGKNFSLLYTEKIPTLAPLYDTLSTAIYPDLTPKMAMKIGGKYIFTEVQGRHWEQFAKSTCLAIAQARTGIIHMANLLPAAARQLQADPKHGFTGNKVVERIIALIEQRCQLTISRLRR